MRPVPLLEGRKTVREHRSKDLGVRHTPPYRHTEVGFLLRETKVFPSPVLRPLVPARLGRRANATRTESTALPPVEKASRKDSQRGGVLEEGSAPR